MEPLWSLENISWYKVTVDFANGEGYIVTQQLQLLFVVLSCTLDWYLQLPNSKAYSNVEHCDKRTET